MEKTYCTQNNGNCSTCSLANYGRDCSNNPIAAAAPSLRKIDKAFALAGIKAMPTVRQHIWRNVTSSIPADVLESMTSKQIAGVIAAANKSFHDGKASAGAEILDDCVWIDKLEMMVPLEAIKRMTVERKTETTMRPGKSVMDDSYLADGTRVSRMQAHNYRPEDLYIKDTRTNTTYRLEYTETC